MAKSTIQLDWYKTLREYLNQSLDYTTKQMYKSHDENIKGGINMHSFYHGEVSAIETMLRKLSELKVVEEKQQESEEK